MLASQELSLSFNTELVEEQRLLSGVRYVTLEGDSETDFGAWTITLNYGQPKELRGSVDEGDVILAGPGGSLFGGLQSGRTDLVTDDLSGDEKERLDLRFLLNAAEGEHEGAGGSIRIRGELTAGQGQLEVEVALLIEE
jgi:hypothetical protein